MSLKSGDVITIKDREGASLKYLKHKGILHMPFIKGSTWDSLDQFKARHDDVWLCSYPKSGTHWLYEILAMLMLNKSDLLPDISDRYFPEFRGSEFLDNLQSPRIFASHLPVKFLPKDVWRKQNKIIYLCRNPKDTIVSAYHMEQSAYLGGYKSSFGAFLETGVYWDRLLTGWYNHVTGWWNMHKNNSSVLFLQYENVHTNPKESIKKIAAFLQLDCNDTTCDNICMKTSIENMKKNKENNVSISFYRKGEVGNWRNYFTVAENEKFDEIFARRMKDSDLFVDFGDRKSKL